MSNIYSERWHFIATHNGAKWDIGADNGANVALVHDDDGDGHLRARLAAAAPNLLEACETILAWLESEDAGPDYGSLTRDTHPEGERIWREWWNRNLRLCQLAQDRAREATQRARPSAADFLSSPAA